MAYIDWLPKILAEKDKTREQPVLDLRLDGAGESRAPVGFRNALKQAKEGLFKSQMV